MDALSRIRSLEVGYAPNVLVANKLKEKSLTALVAPFAVGKTTLMECVTELDYDFAVAGSFTTRDKEPRDEFSKYRFLEDNEKTLLSLATEAEKGDLVQFVTHQTTGKVYGSAVEDYPKPYMMIDLLSYAVANMQALPFYDFKTVSVVCPPAQWVNRIGDRIKQTGNYDDISKRLKESITSLEWSLEQPDMNWINNPNGVPIGAARQIIALAKDGITPKSANRKHGERLLKQARLLV